MQVYFINVIKGIYEKSIGIILPCEKLNIFPLRYSINISSFISMQHCTDYLAIAFKGEKIIKDIQIVWNKLNYLCWQMP